MKVDEPFTGLGICLFGLAAYMDGATWSSGCCAGVGSVMVINWLCTIAARKEADAARTSG